MNVLLLTTDSTHQMVRYKYIMAGRTIIFQMFNVHIDPEENKLRI